MDIDEWRNGRKVWAPVIGRLLLGFGEIEWCLMVCLGPLNDHEGRERWRTADFKKKASEAIRVLSEKHEEHRASKRAVRLINESIKLAACRNLVAHNQLNIGAYPEGHDLKFRLVIASLRDGKKYITFSELTELAEAAENVASELHDTVNAIWSDRE